MIPKNIVPGPTQVLGLLSEGTFTVPYTIIGVWISALKSYFDMWAAIYLTKLDFVRQNIWDQNPPLHSSHSRSKNMLAS